MFVAAVNNLNTDVKQIGPSGAVERCVSNEHVNPFLERARPLMNAWNNKSEEVLQNEFSNNIIDEYD